MPSFPTTTTPPPPIARPLVSDPAEFVRYLYRSWKRAKVVQRERGLSDAVIGEAIYKLLTTVFERSEHHQEDQDAARKKTDPLIPTAELRKALDERIGKAMEGPDRDSTPPPR